MRVQIIGCGDAFGSGGRLQTCFRVQSPGAHFLIDCGASSLPALKRCGVDPATLDFIVITHFHGDHFGGLPFLLVEERIVRRRKNPLCVVGPPGITERVEQACEILFPGSSPVTRIPSVTFHEYNAAEPLQVSGAKIQAFPVVHSEGTHPHAVRVECAGKVVAYSGDTEWTEKLVPAAHHADLFLCEAYFYEKKIPKHLDYRTLAAHRAELRCENLLLTHLHTDMLARLREIPEQAAQDGMVLEI